MRPRKGSSMTTIRFVDTTLRDGNQSLWDATGITTDAVLAVAGHLDKVGFKAVDFVASIHMGVAVRIPQRESMDEDQTCIPSHAEHSTELWHHGSTLHRLQALSRLHHGAGVPVHGRQWNPSGVACRCRPRNRNNPKETLVWQKRQALRTS